MPKKNNNSSTAASTAHWRYLYANQRGKKKKKKVFFKTCLSIKWGEFSGSGIFSFITVPIKTPLQLSITAVYGRGAEGDGGGAAVTSTAIHECPPHPSKSESSKTKVSHFRAVLRPVAQWLLRKFYQHVAQGWGDGGVRYRGWEGGGGVR